MKKFISMLAISTMVLAFWSCSDDDDDGGPTNLAAPVVTAPAASSIQVGTSADLSFSFTAAAGFQTATVAATGGTATITTNGTDAATTGTIVVSYAAGTTAGAGSVTLILTDKEGDTGNATAVLTLTALPVDPSVINVTANLATNTTWKAGKTYILGGRITVLDGATLTIEPGTLIKGEAGTGSNATALLVARGGKLMAEGTAALPIIFTSIADEITPENIAAGNFASPNLEPTVNGLWGGVLVLGRAKISGSNQGNDLSEVQIEGIPGSDLNGLYGGTDDTDNSGVIKYISIRHGGANIGAGNEINGLTLGGIGSATVVENIEVIANQDDGVELFGGTVNVKNIVTWNVGDDGLDTDQAWSGTITNYVIITPGGHGFELDGPEGTFGEPGGVTNIFHTFINGTMVATSPVVAGENLINTDNDSGVKFDGLFITGLANATANNVINRVAPSNGILEFLDVIIDVPAGKVLADFFGVGLTIPAGVTAGSTAIKKADVSVFSWTWTSEAGVLTGL